jgi:hypothetical protein
MNAFRIILFSYLNAWFGQCFVANSLTRKVVSFNSNAYGFNSLRTVISMSGYIPPEFDPEYKDVVVNPVRRRDHVDYPDSESLPYPKEGDVVQYPGKWQGEIDLGKIRFVAFNEVKKSWEADIIPLREGKSDNVYIIDRDAKAFLGEVANLKPVRAYFVRAENGYRVAVKPNSTQYSTQFVLKAPSYRLMNESFSIPIRVREKIINNIMLLRLKAMVYAINRCNIIIANYTDSSGPTAISNGYLRIN